MSDLLSKAAELVAIPSVSRDESLIADFVEQHLSAVPGLEVTRVADNVVGRTMTGPGSRVLLAGHLDTVPASGNAGARLAGDVLWGLGAADMKGGLAVMMEVATRLAEPAFEVTYVFYAGEEISRDHNGLLALEVARPDLLTADVAILGEPTGGAVEAGCQGVLKLEVITGGRRAHSARPWMGVNAVHRLGPVLDLVSAAEAREPEIEGCRYREALQAVRVEGGVAANVVPDRASVVLNHRFAPDRSAGQAEAAVRALLAPALEPELGDRVEVLDLAPAAAPALDHAVLSALVRATGRQPRAKLGWTDVAFFAERGIPAANFGPGDSELAHTTDERVSRDELEDAFAVLWGLLSRH